jgi:hypothetical protein
MTNIQKYAWKDGKMLHLNEGMSFQWERFTHSLSTTHIKITDQGPEIASFASYPTLAPCFPESSG